MHSREGEDDEKQGCWTCRPTGQFRHCSIADVPHALQASPIEQNHVKLAYLHGFEPLRFDCLEFVLFTLAFHLVRDLDGTEPCT